MTGKKHSGLSLRAAFMAAAQAALCLFPAAAMAQNLTVANMSTWFKNNGGGYCDDIDTSLTAAVVNGGPVTGILSSSTIAGTLFRDTDDGSGQCTTASMGAENVNVSGTFTGSTMHGNLAGQDYYGDGFLSGTVSGPVSGSFSHGTVNCIPLVVGNTFEGFGNTLNNSFAWETGGDASWVVITSTRYAGSYSAASDNHTINSYSDLALRVYVRTAGNVTFYSKVQSESGYDFLRFYVDNTERDSWSGDVDWAQQSYWVTVGMHILRWTYRKDGSNSTGDDAAWIDNITIPSNYETYGTMALASTAAITNIPVQGGTQGTTMAAMVSTNAVSNVMVCSGGSQICTGGSYKWFPTNPIIIAASGTVSGSVPFTPVYATGNLKVSDYAGLTGVPAVDSSMIEFERPTYTYPGNCLGLCAGLECTVSTTPISFGIDDLTFEIFRFGSGTNPLDASSTPPIRTISMHNLNTQCSFSSGDNPGKKRLGVHCAAWDGSYNLNGLFGKTNSQFGYRAKVTTQQTTDQGSTVDIEQTAAYPGQNQYPLQVDVMNVHEVTSSATAVGVATKVAVQPFNIKYQLSKDATATITIWDTDAAHAVGGQMPLVRTIISSQPRIGEGDITTPVANGDSWDGRNTYGAVMPAGSYLARVSAGSNDEWGEDLSYPATVQLTLDPLQITDVGVKALGASSTDQAVISYMLTEAATVYVNIYTPGTTFADTNISPPALNSGTLLRSFSEEKAGRAATSTYWDGRDSSGFPACDGDYVYAVWAELPSHGGYGGYSWSSVKTRQTKVGTIPVSRGLVVPSLIPSSTMMGSSPTAAGLNPFYFRYTPARDASVSFNIKDQDGVSVRRTLVSAETRAARVQNTEIWDGVDNAGKYVSSGTYLAELITADPYQCASARVSTVTALVSVDLFRVVDVRTTSLLSSASAQATISYQLTQPMMVDFKVYPKSDVVIPSPWPPAGLSDPVYSVSGIRPTRMNVTESWDGRSNSGLLVPDGSYPFTLIARSSGTAQVMYADDEVYGYMNVTRGQILYSSFEVIPTIPTMYNSSDTVKLPPYGIEYSVTRQSSVTVQVVTLDLQPKVMAVVTSGEVRDGDTVYTDYWDGKCTNTAYCKNNDYVPGSTYNFRVIAEDLAAQLSSRSTVQQTVDVYPMRIYDLSITPLTADAPAVISYQVSEPMKVATKIYKPGTNLNGSGDPVNSLVKRIVGVRPARTQISEYWDGTDLTLNKVPDGNYVFKVYGSTVTTGISTLDGSIIPGTPMADDIITSNIPVTRSATADLCGDFSRQSYFAPNPYTGEAGWFKIPVSISGRVTLRIYNLAGDLVYKKDYPNRGGGDNIDGSGQCAVTHSHEACWPKVNTYGRTVAPGVYFAVLRFEASEGTRDVCQVVKKILVP